MARSSSRSGQATSRRSAPMLRTEVDLPAKSSWRVPLESFRRTSFNTLKRRTKCGMAFAHSSEILSFQSTKITLLFRAFQVQNEGKKSPEHAFLAFVSVIPMESRSISRVWVSGPEWASMNRILLLE